MSATLPNLDQFIADNRNVRLPRNSYVSEPGFSHLYVRIGPRYIGRDKVACVLDLANCAVAPRQQRHGCLKRFLQRLTRDYPELPVFIENVLNPWLPAKLPNYGFERVLRPGQDPDCAPCFVRWPARHGNV
jgi:hypothetical protein